MSLRAVIFDLDGTLLDTERFYKVAFETTAAGLGFNAPPGLHDCVVGLASPDRAKVLQAAWGPSFSFSAFTERYRVERGRALPDCVPAFPGAFSAVKYARAARLAIAIATSASRHTAQSHLVRSGLAGLFDEVVTRDDVNFGKPAPDVYLEAAERLKLEPGECLAVEDSQPGVRAAVSAGMTCVRISAKPCPLADASLKALSDLPDWMQREFGRRKVASRSSEFTGAAS